MIQQNYFHRFVSN